MPSLFISRIGLVGNVRLWPKSGERGGGQGLSTEAAGRQSLVLSWRRRIAATRPTLVGSLRGSSVSLNLDTEGTAGVGRALRWEPEERGHAVGGDTVGLKRDLHIRGDYDCTAALFESKSTSEEAVETICRGSRPTSMSPRFAAPDFPERRPPVRHVWPGGLSTLFSEVAPTGVVFVDLGGALDPGRRTA